MKLILGTGVKGLNFASVGWILNYFIKTILKIFSLIYL